MNRERLYQYIENPHSLNERSLIELEEILKEYPYFQTAHLLYLRNLKMLGHLRFNKQLRISSAYITDRAVLYSFLHDLIEPEAEAAKSHTKADQMLAEIDGASSQAEASLRIIDPVEDKAAQTIREEQKFEYEKFDEKVSAHLSNDADPVIKRKESKQAARKKKILEKLPKLKKEREQSDRLREKLMTKVSVARKPALDYFEQEDEEASKFDDYIGSFLIDDEEKSITEDQLIPKMQEVDGEKPAKLFSKEDKRETLKTDGSSKEDASLSLIDKFIAAQPKMSSTIDAEVPVYDVSSSSVADNDDFITETLAHIYLEQKHFDKAIHAYQKLSLKYPEKSIYFASQIRKLEELKNK